MPQKVTSPASAICNSVSSGEVSRHGLVSLSVGPERHVPKRTVDVVERLREQIRCIEGRTPVLNPIKPATVQAPGWSAAVANGLPDDRNCRAQGAHGMTLSREPMPDQTGFPAARFADEDGGALPRALPSSSFHQSCCNQHRGSINDRTQSLAADWTLGRVSEYVQRGSSGDRITELALDDAGVHEIKPALNIDSGSHTISGGVRDWAASWSAAKAFTLAMASCRLVGDETVDHDATDQAMRRPILWCVPRGAKSEHGALYGHGLRCYGLTCADVLIVETANPQDTLWVLEEGLKSKSLSMVVCLIDDVALTPARRLALAAQKHRTPCLLLTHPRMPPVAATATRWRVGAAPGASHPLNMNNLGSEIGRHGLDSSRRSPRFHGIGARRFGLTLERYRAAPVHVTGRESVVEWSDEAFCLSMVADVSDRSPAPRLTSIRAAQASFRAS